jgi:signal peptidase II
VLAVAVAVATVILDQVTKAAVVGGMGIGERSPVFGTFLRLTHIRNSGAVFGMMRGAGTYFTFFSIVAAAVLVVVLFVAKRASTLVRVSLGMVLGGAVGNLIDRLRYGAVVDFLDVGISESVRWPCFNVADSAITVGVFLLIVSSFARPEHSVGASAAVEAGGGGAGADSGDSSSGPTA